jgi:hypothetical protein
MRRGGLQAGSPPRPSGHPLRQEGRIARGQYPAQDQRSVIFQDAGDNT